MNYALDITNPKIKQAMENLGIDKDELIIKTINDLGGKNTREEIKQLRLDYYSKRLQETVKLIKDSLKSSVDKGKSEFSKTESFLSNFEAEKILTEKHSTEGKKIFLNEKNREVLMTALEEIKEEASPLPKKERPKSMIQPRSLKLTRLEQFKKNQQQNFVKIKNQEETQVRKALNESFNLPSKLKKNKDPRSLSISSKKPLQYSESEEEIINKLLKFEQKLEKSNELHQKQIDLKRQSLRSHYSTVRLDQSEAPQSEIIFKIIERSKVVTERKEKLSQQEKEK